MNASQGNFGMFKRVGWSFDKKSLLKYIVSFVFFSVNVLMLYQNGLTFPFVLIYTSSMLASVDWKSLLQIDVQVSRNVVEHFNREPESVIELESREVFSSFDQKLQKQMQVVDDVYRQTEAMGFRIERDSYGGFGLFKRSQRNIWSGVLKFPLGFLRDKPIDQQKSVNPISVMSRGNDNDFIALNGSITFVKLFCRAKTQNYWKFPYEGSPCVRLKVINEILSDEEKTVFYGSDFFYDNNVNRQCPNHTSIKLKRAPSRHRRLELPPLPESRFRSRTFTFVLAHGREGSESPLSIEENVRGFPSSCLANAALDSIETPFAKFVEADNDKHFEPWSSVVVESQAECDVLESDCTFSAGAASKRSLELKFPSGYRGLVDNITVFNATLSLLAIVSKYCGSEEFLYDLVRRERLNMDSTKNQCIPPPGFLKNILKEAPHALIRDLDTNENGDFARLNFHIILLDTVESNLNAILEFHRIEGVDLKLPKLLNGDTLSFRLILKIEGCQPFESLAKMGAFVLWAAVVDLYNHETRWIEKYASLFLVFWQRKARLSKCVQSFFKQNCAKLHNTIDYQDLKKLIHSNSDHLWFNCQSKIIEYVAVQWLLCLFYVLYARISSKRCTCLPPFWTLSNEDPVRTYDIDEESGTG